MRDFELNKELAEFSAMLKYRARLYDLYYPNDAAVGAELSLELIRERVMALCALTK